MTYDHPYLFGVVVSHLFETGEYFAAWEREQPIVEFNAELGSRADGYRELRDTYTRRKVELAKIRNNHTFHCGRREQSKNPLVRQALSAVANEPGVVRVSEVSGTFGFASEVAAAIFTISCGGSEPGAGEIGVLLGEVAGALIDFNVFAHEAIKHFLDRSGVPVKVTTNS